MVLLVVVLLQGYCCTYAVGYALAANVDASEPLRAEDGGLGEPASVPGLIEPGKLTVETALAAEHLLEGPEVVPVPEEELGVTVNVGGQGLVESDEILISGGRLAKLARGRAGLEALDGIDVRLTVGVGIRVPLAADAGAGAGALPLLKLLQLLVQIAGGDRKDGRDDAGKLEFRELILGVLDVLDDGGDGSIDTRQSFIERERASELGCVEVVGWESRRKRDVGGKRCTLGWGRVLGKRNGGSGGRQDDCGE